MNTKQLMAEMKATYAARPANQRETAQMTAIGEAFELVTQLINGVVTYESFAAKVADTARKTPKLEVGDLEPITGLRITKLKHAGKANKGQFIRARDFALVEDTYLEGMVLNENDPHPEQGVPSYKIIVTRDVRGSQAYVGTQTRVGDVGWVPHEVAIIESEERVTLVAFEDGDIDTVYVDRAYRESGLNHLQVADAMALVANANDSARIAREGCFAEQPNPRTMLNQWIAQELHQQHIDQQAAARENSDRYGDDN